MEVASGQKKMLGFCEPSIFSDQFAIGLKLSLVRTISFITCVAFFLQHFQSKLIILLQKQNDEVLNANSKLLDLYDNSKTLLKRLLLYRSLFYYSRCICYETSLSYNDNVPICTFYCMLYLCFFTNAT